MTPEQYHSADYLPQGFYPWPDLINPHAEQMGKDMDGWIDNDYTFLTEKQRVTYKKMRLHMCTARMWPDLTYEQAIPCNRFMLQYVALDDQMEDLPLEEIQQLRIRCTDILRGAQPRPEENALYHHMALIRDEFRALMPDIWVERFIFYFYQSFRYGIELEYPYKIAQRPPSLTLFKTIREYSVLMRPYLIFGEIESGLVLPEHIFEHIVVQKMISHMTLVVAWQNDIHSLPKEMAKGTEVFNLIFVLQQEYNLSLQDACAEALHIHNEELANAVALHSEYREFGEYQEHVDKFVHYAGVGLQGVNSFYLETERYRHGGAGFAWPEQTPQTI
ncbi:terpene synthase family protein [Taibaiella helva]|uniref:terpene synthase family protein n=1 Tax=Taibaiella helva TaxID=2301235 RepID=UPI001300284D|nr:terpene synthase family protein [Taibaiella helva]